MSNEKAIRKVKKILLKHGIKIDVGACGCCESPWFSMEYKGKTIVNNAENFRFNMIENNNINSCKIK